MHKSSIAVLVLAVVQSAVLSSGCSRPKEEPQPQVPEPEMPAIVDQLPSAFVSSPTSSVAVEVNGNKLTETEIRNQALRYMSQVSGGDNMTEDQMNVAVSSLRKRIIDDFINQTLIEAEIERLGLKVTEDELEDGYKKFENDLPGGMSLNLFLQQHKIGEDQFRNMIEARLQFDKLLKLNATNGMEVTDEEIDDFCNRNREMLQLPERVHARHILIAVDAKDDEATVEEKKSKAERIRQELLGGADFAETAKAHSDCPTGKRGGDLGTFPRERMVAEFSDAAFSQKVDEIGPVIKTDFGFHIIQALDHQQAGEVPREAVKHRLNRQKQDRIFADITARLRSGANIRYGAQ